jgi:hypothetical protein
MRLRVPVIVLVVALLTLGAGCGDDSDSDETRAGDSESPSSTTSSSASTSAPSTSSTSSTSEPAQGGSMPSRPAELTGEVTDSQGGRFLVEEQPDAPDSGRKAWVAIDGPVFRSASGGDPTPAAASDIERGQQVSVWTGICAESYPEQCGAEAFLIH